MKKMRFLAIAAMVVAAGSAFAGTLKSEVAASYLSTKIGTNPCNDADEGVIQECGGNGATCTILGKTYFEDDNCGTVLQFN